MATVLIATMDSLVYDALSAEVAGEGHTVLWAADGYEAVELTASHTPELLFLEASLPIYGGFEVAELLRGDPDIPAALPVILLADEDVDPHQFERSGFTARFPKTHGYFELRELLAAHIRPGSVVW